MFNSDMKKVCILKPISISSYQFFYSWFFDSCVRGGIPAVKAYKIPWIVRLVVARLKLSFRFPKWITRKRKIIVLCGGYPDSFVFPYGYFNDVVPVLWDTWPRYHERIVQSFLRHKITLAFFTQRQVAELIQQRVPGVKCVWLPEGINSKAYYRGVDLRDRNIDLLELGRLMPRFHDALYFNKGKINHKFKNPTEGLLFPDFESLALGLADSKITICFPRCDTHPEMSGCIETMTQRYWECMLSRTLILGRSPRELIDLIGYDPCIEVDWNDPTKQVCEILIDIMTNDRYQKLVDRNYTVAQEKASWDNRMNIISEYLK